MPQDWASHIAAKLQALNHVAEEVRQVEIFVTMWFSVAVLGVKLF